MIYAERAYFDGDHCQHCADREEFLRLQHKHHQSIIAYRRDRRMNSRRLAA